MQQCQDLAECGKGEKGGAVFSALYIIHSSFFEKGGSEREGAGLGKSESGSEGAMMQRELRGARWNARERATDFHRISTRERRGISLQKSDVGYDGR
jgi:hypothetical protein